MKSGWIGVDLDGTLAKDVGHTVPDRIGPPVPAMLKRVKQWVADKEDVRIFTARVAYKPGDRRGMLYANIARQAILAWCQQHVGKQLAVTCQKDHNMKALYDDRAVQVVRNTGEIVGNVIR